MKFEILAPAGSMESLIAGVRSGTNAVYLGGKSFNARRNAGNFDDDELERAVEYCHSHGVKLYLTLNILVRDDEFEQLYSIVKHALGAGVDAFIVQDIGAASFIREHFPQARLHASTQMSIMTPSGVEYARSLGFSRVVLPREMNIDEIAQIKETSDIELEMFVHGALCFCVSGQCYLSSVIGSRSGNRGLCAQPCRLPFTAGDNRNETALSLKDLSLIEDLSLLDGITSLKIEGRMKRPEYVSSAVSSLKKAIDNSLTGDDKRVLRSVFSRSGFTNAYLTGKLGSDMFGRREKEDVVSAGKVLKEIRRNYDKEKPLVKMDMSFTCKKDEPAVLSVNALGRNASVTGEVPQMAITKPMTAEGVKQRLAKLGSTQFYAGEIEVKLGDGLILPAAKINDMRRTAVEIISKEPEHTVSCKAFVPIKRTHKSSTPYLTASFSDARQIPQRHIFKQVFIPLSSSLEDFIDNRAGAVIPRGLFGMEREVESRLQKLKKAGVTKILCGNIGAYHLAKNMGFEVYGDYSLNIFNSNSAKMIDNPILSFELTIEQANAVEGANTGVIAYGRIPLMLARNCPIKASVGCNRCKRNGRLKDRKGCEFPVICSDYPCVEILNCVPIYMLDVMDEIKTDFAHFYFSTETSRDVEKIISLYENAEKAPFKYTRGLYYRGTI